MRASFCFIAIDKLLSTFTNNLIERWISEVWNKEVAGLNLDIGFIFSIHLSDCAFFLWF